MIKTSGYGTINLSYGCLTLALFFAVGLGSLVLYSFPPYNYTVIIIVAYILLFWAAVNIKPAQVFLIALAYGCGVFFRGMFWVYSFGTWVDPEFLYSVIIIDTVILFLLALVGAAFPAFISAFMLKKWGGRSFFIMVTAVFCLFEWIRSVLFTGLPYFQPGFLLIDTPLANFAPLAGSLSVTFAFFLSVAAILEFFQAKSVSARMVPIIATGTLWLAAIVVGFMDFSTNEGVYRFRIIHGTAVNEDKELRYKQRDRIKKYLSYTVSSPAPDLAVWPEGVIRGGQGLNNLVNRSATAIKRQTGTDILLGGYIDNYGKSYNALISGEKLKILYKKVHLIPFGEYTPDIPIPFLNLGQHLPEINNDSLDKGETNQPVAHVGNFTVRAGICFEILFGAEVSQTEADYDFYVHISDLSWFINTPVAQHMLQVARMRAREIAKPVIRSTNFGVSSAIDHKGNVLARMDGEKPGFIDAEVSIRSGFTPYAFAGDLPILLICLLIIINKHISKSKIARKTQIHIPYFSTWELENI